MRQDFGYIYKVINDVNDKVYVGETARTLDVRFAEHCFDKRSTSKIHKSIKEIGSIDIKHDEKAILDLAENLSVPFKTTFKF